MALDQFTLDLFGNTGRSSGLGLGLGFGVAGRAGTPAANEAHERIPLEEPGPTQRYSAPKIATRTNHGQNFYLDGERGLGVGWKERARINVAMIGLASEITRQNRAATREEQARLIRFTGFGASELANGMFRRPGEPEFRKGWNDLGDALENAVSENDYASFARCTQYAGTVTLTAAGRLWRMAAKRVRQRKILRPVATKWSSPRCEASYIQLRSFRGAGSGIGWRSDRELRRSAAHGGPI